MVDFESILKVFFGFRILTVLNLVTIFCVHYGIVIDVHLYEQREREREIIASTNPLCSI